MKSMIDIAESYLTQVSPMPETYLQQAESYKSSGEWEQALFYYQQALETEAEDWQIFSGLGDVLLNLERTEEATVAYQQSLELNPEFDWTYHNLAVALNKLGRFEEADFYYEKLAELNPVFEQINQHDPQVQRQFGEFYLRREQWDKAALAYRQAIELSSNIEWNYINLGRALGQLLQVDAAIAAFQKAIELKPDSVEAYQYLCQLLIDQDRLSDATELYQSAIADGLILPEISSIQPVQAIVKAKGQRNSEADEFDWEFYRQFNPDLQGLATYEVAYAHWVEHGQFEGRYPSEQALRKYLEQKQADIPADFDPRGYIILNPDIQVICLDNPYVATWHFLFYGQREGRAYALDAAAVALVWNEFVQQKGWLETLEFYRYGIEQEPQAAVYLAMGEMLAKLGRWEEAIAAQRQVVALGGQNAASLRQVTKTISQRLVPLFLKQKPQEKILNAVLELFQLDSENWQKILADYQQIPFLHPNLTHAIEQTTEAYINLLMALGETKEAEKLVLPCSESPLVSVVIPVYNKIDYTYRCLQSLAKQLDPNLAIEIMVVNDCSTDETEAILQQVEGLILINNAENSGFICSCNNGAAQAKGKYIYFLNNDTEILPGSIEELVAVLEADETVGAVGSKLVYPNGQLQEAGGVIWDTAEGWNYGRMQNPFDPQYNYLRSADYCSAASLLVRRWVFEALDGFERAFIPAYYEDTDLCFGIRNILSLKVVCQPKSEIIHYEGISSGTSTTSGVKRYQVINHAKFQEKWQTALTAHLPNKGAGLIARAARRFSGTQTILMINPYPPCHDKESGARRLFELIKIFKQLDYHVIFAPENGYKEEPYTSQLQNLGVEMLYTQAGYGKPVIEQIAERLEIIDVAWICFPDLTQKYLPIFRQHPHIKIIYDTIDLHYLRLKRAWEMLPVPRDVQKAREWAEMRTLELEMAKQADLTLTVTAIEQKLLQEQAVPNVAVVPNIHRPYLGEKPGFGQRAGLLFIGGYNHPPNVDGVRWLCETVMPYVWQQMPGISVTLLGSNPSAQVKQLAEQDERISVPGFVEDVTPYFLSHRVFVAPLRYGAGMKGKVGQSLEYGLPLVSTTIGVEGMGLSEEHVLVADTAEDFAYQILRLYTDQALWEELAANSLSGIEPFTAEAVKMSLQSLLSGFQPQRDQRHFRSFQESL